MPDQERTTYSMHVTEDGRVVYLPALEMVMVLRLARLTDSIIFWEYKDSLGGWQPYLFPRSTYVDEAEMARAA